MAEYIKKTDAMSDAMCTGIACRECSFDSVDGCKLSKFFNELSTIDIVHCSECVYEDCGMCSHVGHEWERHEADYFCADGERRAE